MMLARRQAGSADGVEETACQDVPIFTDELGAQELAEAVQAVGSIPAYVTHASVLIKGTAANTQFQLDFGPYDALPPPEDATVAATLGGRTHFGQRNGKSVLYWIEECWVIGTTVGSFADAR